MRKSFWLLIPVLCIWACESEPETPALFELRSANETGITFSNDLSDSPDFNILEYLYFYNGAGVAAGDFNNDGLPDLYFSANQQSNKLYLNKGSFQFEDITQPAGVAGTGTWSTGVTVADVNGDGWLDIYLSQVGDYKEAKGKNQLFINNGDLTFTESAAQYGLDFVGFSTQAAFFDYDRDGDLDMYLLNHSIKNPAVFSKAENRTTTDEVGGDRLFQSQLAQGAEKFVDVTAKAGIYSSNLGFGLGLAVSDVDNDGWLDIYVSNDFTENDYLYINNQDGTFSEELESRIAYTSRYSMGNAAGDLNNDGLNEIITTDMLPSDPEIWQKSVGEDKAEVYDIKLNFGYAHQYVRNTLQKNLGNGAFSDVSLMAGTYATDWSWAPLIFDMDGDGWQDLHISNGIYKRPNDLDYVNYGQDQAGVKAMTPDELEAFQIENLPAVKIPNYAGKNLAGLRFEPIADTWGLNQSSYSNGSAYADLDGDGDPDLVVNNTNQEAFIYENKANEITQARFLAVKLEAEGFNTNGIGARITLVTSQGNQTREIMPTTGFQSAVAPVAYFGLGNEPGVESVLVRWPDGTEQRVEAPGTDTVLVVKYAGVEASQPEGERKDLFDVTLFDGYKHEENSAYKDYDREYLIPRKFSTEGPALAVADVNGDGLDDIYLGGAKEQAGSLWIQQTDGTFAQKANRNFEMLARAEDTDALFFDANGDGHPDLYVVSGGNEYDNGQVFTFDRLYFNDGKGNLQFTPGALPQFGTHGKTVKAADIDGDGDQDLFVGANIVRGAYGVNPKHHVLINDGRGRFTDGTAKTIPFAANLGMINDAVWFDFGNDGDMDLALAGEWMEVTLLENDGSGRFSKRKSLGLKDSEGWWFSITAADVDGDGDEDLIAGNLGLNSKLKASEEKPLDLYVNDFDRNGQVDPVLFHFMGEANIPFATRDDLIKQMSFIKKKHPDYEAYAKVSKPQDLFTPELLEQSLRKRAVTFASTIFFNEGDGDFTRYHLPVEAQLSPAMDVLTTDVDGDGKKDLLIAGNFYGFRNDIGRSAARPFTLLKGDGKRGFQTLEAPQLNSYVSRGEYRKLALIKGADGQSRIIAVRNDEKPLLFSLKPQ